MMMKEIEEKKYLNQEIREDINIGIAVPVHISHIDLFRKYCLPSILNLNPRPYKTYIC